MMNSGIHTARAYILILMLASVILLFGCATTPKIPLALASDFNELNIKKLALVPVAFDRWYEPPYDIDLDHELRTHAKTTLEKKGYEVILVEQTALSPTASPGDLTAPTTRPIDAELAIRVDFLFISETFGERYPPPVIEIEAEARLIAPEKRREVWRDRGAGKAGGIGRSRIVYPDLARRLALDLLCDRLFDTLPDVYGE